MLKTKREKIRTAAFRTLEITHGILMSDEDICMVNCVAYISSYATSKLLCTSYHNFSNVYVELLLGAGVSKVVCGRCKFYNLNKVLNILDRSRSKGISVLSQCREIKNNRKKRLKKLKGKK